MSAGFQGTFVIAWAQTELDGLAAAPVRALMPGAVWSWRGEVLRVDGPNGVLRLGRAGGDPEARRRAARRVRRMVGAALAPRARPAPEGDDPALADSGFVVTDGTQSYTVTLIDTGQSTPPLLMFHDEIPPRDREMWVVRVAAGAARQARQGRPAPLAAPRGDMICFTPGTRIRTPDGPRPVEELREGDRVETRDSGAQPVEWIGRRRITGARLFALPQLRPVRIRSGALGIERPDQELLISPDHRMLIGGDAARALFNAPEVLIAARDLINHGTISVDLTVREVTYIHLLLPQHQIIWANGVETESFHPASASMEMLEPQDRARLLERDSRLADDPHGYGAFARRPLSGPEAAILAHKVA